MTVGQFLNGMLIVAGVGVVSTCVHVWHRYRAHQPPRPARRVSYTDVWVPDCTLGGRHGGRGRAR